VDAQLSRAINARRAPPRPFALTKLVLAFLKAQQLLPLVAQHAVGCDKLRIGTAVDILALDKRAGSLWCLELKCVSV